MNRRKLLWATCAAAAFSNRSEAASDITALATKLASENQICAVAAATLKEGKPSQSLTVSGCASVLNADAVFQAASLGKPVMAYIVLRLAQRGKISLDAPASDTFPNGYSHRQNIFALKAAPIIDLVSADMLRDVTPRRLLSHSVGFPNWSPSGPLTLDFTPGTRWQYSGEGYILLQRMLETITGRPLQELAETEVFAPMGLTSTAFKLTDAILPRLVPGSPRQLRFPYEIASSSLYTTAGDYARFVSAVLNDEPTLSLITQNPVPVSTAGLFRSMSLGWGLGWGIEEREQPASIWHWGSNPGFRSLVLADLRSRNAIVVLTASDKGMALAKQLVNAVISGEHPGLELNLVQ